MVGLLIEPTRYDASLSAVDLNGCGPYKRLSWVETYHFVAATEVSRGSVYTKVITLIMSMFEIVVSRTGRG